MSDLAPFADRIWTLAGDPVRFYGVPFATRSVIVRLVDGGLWVHSPVALTAERRAAVEDLGTVRFLIAPNLIHSLGIAAWRQVWPDAEVWVSPWFHDRHPQVTFAGTLGDEAPPPWAADLDQHVFAGHKLLDEVIFLHKSSGTLLVTDLIQKHDSQAEAWIWRRLKRWAGILGPDGGMARDIRAGFTDREAARRSRDHILAWTFDRLIISHGLCLRKGAKAEVARVWSCLD